MIGDTEYFKTNDCTVVRPTQDNTLVPIFVSIGYTSIGVNYVKFVFAPSYDSNDADKEVPLTMGLPSADMNYEDLAFSQKNAFIGFTGVTSDFGLPVNKLGVAYFLCAPLIDSDE